MTSNEIIIFYFPGLSKEALIEIKKQMVKVFDKYGIAPIFTNQELQTISKDDLQKMMNDIWGKLQK